MFGLRFWPQRANFWVYFEVQRSINNLQRFCVKNLLILAELRVIFDHFGGQKSRFLDFFKVVLELFRKCLGIVFGLKRPTFILFANRIWVSPLSSREALINVDKAPHGLLVMFWTFFYVESSYGEDPSSTRGPSGPSGTNGPRTLSGRAKVLRSIYQRPF